MNPEELERWVQARLDAADTPPDWEEGRHERMRRAAARAAAEFAHAPVEASPHSPNPVAEELPAPRSTPWWALAAVAAVVAMALVPFFQRPAPALPTTPEPVTQAAVAATPTPQPPPPEPAAPPPPPAPREAAPPPPTPKVAPPPPRPTATPAAVEVLALRQDWPAPPRADLRRAVHKGVGTRGGRALQVTPSGPRTVGQDVGFTVTVAREEARTLCVLGPESGVVWNGLLSPGSTLLTVGAANQRFRFSEPGEYRFVLSPLSDCRSIVAEHTVTVSP